MTLERRRQRLRGCLLGGAYGDALGLPFEGRGPRDDVRWTSGLVSDDTQLTLATCEALVESAGRVEPEVIARHMARWWSQGRITGAGAATTAALQGLAAGGHWALVGRRGDQAAGNGAAMRVAPLAFVLDPRDAQARRTLRDVCRITHHSEDAYVGALAVCLAVHRALHDQPILDGLANDLPDSGVRDRLAELATSTASLRTLAERHGTSGWVVESVPLALVAAHRAIEHGFTTTLVELVACGGDTDTMAAIAGQIAGAALGADALPDEVDRLTCRELIVDLAAAWARD